MRRYETILIIKPSASEDDLTEIVNRNTAIIQDNFKGTILTIDKWGLRKLAYLINKEPQGYYIYMQYAGMPEAVDEMERLLRIDDRVLKYMTIKLQDQYVPGEDDDKIYSGPVSKTEFTGEPTEESWTEEGWEDHTDHSDSVEEE